MKRKVTGTPVGIPDIAPLAGATTSDPELKQEAGRWYRDQQQKLGIAQRGRKKHRIRDIHTRAQNLRKDTLHKFSRRLVDHSATIFVGNVSSQKLVKTRMAKSVLDAGRGQLKPLLEYKYAHAGMIFEEIDGSYTTQYCPCAGQSSPAV